jgi:hypothetical protein
MHELCCALVILSCTVDGGLMLHHPAVEQSLSPSYRCISINDEWPLPHHSTGVQASVR